MTLRPVTDADATAVYELYSHPEVCRFFDLEPMTEAAQARDHVARWTAGAAAGTQYRWVVEDGGRFAGTIGLYAVVGHQKRASVGFDLLPGFQGRGLMTQALSALVPDWHNRLGLHRIQATVLPANTASKALLGRAGFRYEGTLVGYERWPGKGFVDLEMWARVSTAG